NRGKHPESLWAASREVTTPQCMLQNGKRLRHDDGHPSRHASHVKFRIRLRQHLVGVLWSFMPGPQIHARNLKYHNFLLQVVRQDVQWTVQITPTQEGLPLLAVEKE